MLNFWLRWVTLLWLGSAGCVWLALERGDQRLPTTPGVNLGFAACELPCWADITVGETTFNEAIIALAATFPPETSDAFVTDRQINLWLDDSSSAVHFNANVDAHGGIVNDVRLTPPYTLGELVQQLGTPTCARTDQPHNHAAMGVYWQGDGYSLGMVVTADDSALEPSDTVDSLWISARQRPCDSLFARPWFGFASWSRYFASPS